jgi:hypothetical protein
MNTYNNIDKLKKENVINLHNYQFYNSAAVNVNLSPKRVSFACM